MPALFVELIAACCQQPSPRELRQQRAEHLQRYRLRAHDLELVAIPALHYPLIRPLI